MSGSQNVSEPSAASQPRNKLPGYLIFGLIATAILVAGIAVLCVDPSGRAGNGLSARFDYDTETYASVDPKLLSHREATGFLVSLDVPTSIAVGPEGRVLVGGDRSVVVYDAEGRPIAEWPLEGKPTCLGVGGPEHVFPGRVYVGVGDRVVVLHPDGKTAGVWSEGLNEGSLLTSIAVAEEDVFVADAGNRVVCRCDVDGKLLGKIGVPDADRGVRGFVIPSPYFDVAVTPDGLLRIANPGARKIETYTFAGDLLGSWGAASARIEGFFGCCNPANFAVLPDGRFITCEKGIPRIKVYSRTGEFESVVADPKILGQRPDLADEIRDQHQAKVFDVAIDSLGRVVVLDPSKRMVRFFESNERSADSPDPAG